MAISEKTTLLKKLEIMQKIINNMQKFINITTPTVPLCSYCHEPINIFEPSHELVCENPLCESNDYQPSI